MSARMSRRWPAGEPLQLRNLVFNSTRCGRLTNGEFDLLDVATRESATDVSTIAAVMGKSAQTVERKWRHMKDCGIVAGEPSAFTITLAGQVAYRQTDQYLLHPEHRPAKRRRPRRRLQAPRSASIEAAA